MSRHAPIRGLRPLIQRRLTSSSDGTKTIAGFARDCGMSQWWSWLVLQVQASLLWFGPGLCPRSAPSASRGSSSRFGRGIPISGAWPRWQMLWTQTEAKRAKRAVAWLRNQGISEIFSEGEHPNAVVKFSCASTSSRSSTRFVTPPRNAAHLLPASSPLRMTWRLRRA